MKRFVTPTQGISVSEMFNLPRRFTSFFVVLSRVCIHELICIFKMSFCQMFHFETEGKVFGFHYFFP